MTTASYTPRNTEQGYLRRYYQTLDDVRDECFDAILITGAPIETMPFEEVGYWDELVEFSTGHKPTVSADWGYAGGAQALLYHFHAVPKHLLGSEAVRGVRSPGDGKPVAADERVHR